MSKRIYKPRSYHDSVHGNIELPDYCWKIIDTPQFQRLADLKQLGCAYYVYPGATHTRKEHSIGVAHLGGRMLTRLRVSNDPRVPMLRVSNFASLTLVQELQPALNITDREIMLVRIAGLCKCQDRC